MAGWQAPATAQHNMEQQLQHTTAAAILLHHTPPLSAPPHTCAGIGAATAAALALRAAALRAAALGAANPLEDCAQQATPALIASRRCLLAACQLLCALLGSWRRLLATERCRRAAQRSTAGIGQWLVSQQRMSEVGSSSSRSSAY